MLSANGRSLVPGPQPLTAQLPSAESLTHHGICVSATIVTVVRFRPPAGPCAFDGRKYLSRQGYDSVMCYNLLSDFGRRRLWAFNWRKYPMICRRCHDDLAGGVDGVRGRDQRLKSLPTRSVSGGLRLQPAAAGTWSALPTPSRTNFISLWQTLRSRRPRPK